MSALPNIEYVNWDLTPFFSDIEGEEFHQYRDDLSDEVSALEQVFNTLPGLDIDRLERWVEALLRLESAEIEVLHLDSYLRCLSSTGLTADSVSSALSAFDGFRTSIDQCLAFTKFELAAASDETFQKLCRHDRLSSARHKLGQLRKEGLQGLSYEQGKLAAALKTTGLVAWSRLYEKLGNASFHLELSGEPTSQRPLSLLRASLADPDPEIRTAAYAGGRRAWAKSSELAATCLNNIAGTRLNLVRHTEIQSPKHEAFFHAGISARTVEVLLRAIWDNRHICQRYLRLKAGFLGRSNPLYQDLRAPLSSHTGPLPLHHARALVADAFASSFPALSRHAHHVFDKGWIDTQPGAGRAPGGYCVPSPKLKQSRVFMTFAGSAADLSILAHEIGHSYHWHKLKDERLFRQQPPITTSETAALFSECLVRQNIIDGDQEFDLRLMLLGAQLDAASAYLLEVPAHYEFDVAFYEERDNGELPLERISEIMVEAQAKWFGALFAEDNLNELAWAWFPQHFSPSIGFYTFPYAFAFLLSQALLDRFSRDAGEFIRTFDRVLALSGSASVEALLMDHFSIELTDEAFWQQSFDRLRADLARFEDIASAGLDDRDGR